MLAVTLRVLRLAARERVSAAMALFTTRFSLCEVHVSGDDLPFSPCKNIINPP